MLQFIHKLTAICHIIKLKKIQIVILLSSYRAMIFIARTMLWQGISLSIRLSVTRLY